MYIIIFYLPSLSGHYAIALFKYQRQNKKAQLLTPSHAPASSRCVVFYYSVTGRATGTLNVYLLKSNGTSPGLLRWSYTGITTSAWNYARVSIDSAADSFKVVFEAVVGASSTGMVSIDDVVSQDSPCKNNIDENDGEKEEEEEEKKKEEREEVEDEDRSLMASVYDCDFEALNFCKWSLASDDQFDWQLRQVSSLGSGPYTPTADHTRGTSQGKILIMPVTVNRKPDETAGLISPVLSAAGSRGNCLTFWYRLYGPENDGLRVYTKSGSSPGGTILMWTRRGTSGDAWKKAVVETKGTASYQVRIARLVLSFEY
ncbi:MAM and LDL-receptor class a domain-containing protein 1 [Plakobranchus ocellatus]|uniref:MAM and LDL-receptor class a domain-containing protein 1 n=1 Tax=Plakobranchus ocellatus TaxID=259542 RepID=A0AAV3YQ22_9GAST|nr:MAM and LDL-receptor class a domain-containing protein 1 [Plakobranchus ocellatus]